VPFLSHLLLSSTFSPDFWAGPTIGSKEFGPEKYYSTVGAILNIYWKSPFVWI